MIQSFQYDALTPEDIVELIYQMKHQSGAVLIKNVTGDVTSVFSNLFLQARLELDYRQYSIDGDLELSSWWEISNQQSKDRSYAHSKTRQPFHNDNAWFSDPAEINLFYMQKQVKVGGNQLVYRINDLVEDLADYDQKLLDKLLSTKVHIFKGDGKYSNYTEILKLTPDGHQSFWNYYRTEKGTDEIRELCDQFFEFLNMQLDQNAKNIHELRSESNDVFFLNDQLNMHARQAFEADEDRSRVLYQSMWKFKDEIS